MRTVIFFAVLCSALQLSPSNAHAENLFFELRTYHANEGRLNDLHNRFREHTLQLFEKHGMTNLGYWVPNNEEDTLVYLLGYPNEEAREKSWKAFRDDPDWEAAYNTSTANGKLVKKIDAIFLSPTKYSPGFTIEAQDPARLFELRIYTTVPGKLDDLHARFRDHTIALFEKHGITNLGYFTPANNKHGGARRLYYFIAHKDETGRAHAFRAFARDPDWQEAKKKSEEDGKILVQKGVKATFLLPTNYSPTR